MNAKAGLNSPLSSRSNRPFPFMIKGSENGAPHGLSSSLIPHLVFSSSLRDFRMEKEPGDRLTSSLTRHKVYRRSVQPA